MSDKTEMLIVEVEKHPILYDKGRQDLKDAEKKKNAWKRIAQGVGSSESVSQRRLLPFS